VERPPAALTPEEEVKKVALEINQAFVRNDLESVAKYVADDITWFSHTSTKRQDGKKVFVDALRQSMAGKKTIRWQEHDMVVQVFGDSALVTFLYDHDAEINGKRSSRAVSTDILHFCASSRRVRPRLFTGRPLTPGYGLALCSSDRMVPVFRPSPPRRTGPRALRSQSAVSSRWSCGGVE
jgi:ketosteroid isomerase-like protein